METHNLYYNKNKKFEKDIRNLSIVKDKEVLVQVFTSLFKIKQIKKLQKTILDLIPNAKIIGATTDGEILKGKVSTGKTVVTITVFEKTKVEAFCAEYKENSCGTCYDFGKNISSLCKGKPRVIITFSDGLHINGEEYLKGLKAGHPESIVAGGLAGARGEFLKTYVFDSYNIYEKGAVFAALHNEDLNVFTNYSFEWSTIGKSMTITKSRGNVVYTIDDKSAVDTYAYYLGEETAKRLPKVGIEFPLVLNRNGQKIGRAVINKRVDGALEFAGNLYEGEVVQFGYADSHAVLGNDEFYTSMGNRPVETIFVYSCMARRRFLPDLIHKEIDPLTKLAPVSGFFTHGEYFCWDDQCQLLNQTMSILAISECKKKNDFCYDMKKDNDLFETRKALVSLIDTTVKELKQSNEKLNNINERLEQEVKQKILELREKDRVLIHQSKMASMGEMLGNIAHQWRQPLNNISAINMKVETILEIKETLSNEEYKPISESLNKQLEYMSRTIDDFRDFFKTDKVKEPSNLKEVLLDVYNLVKIQFNNKNIEIELDIYDIQMYIVKNELKQVLLNILNNSKEAILQNYVENGFIKIGFKENNDFLQIEILDNGKGIRENIINRVFEPYFTTKFKSKGTGIGLYMSYQIIKEHFNGDITVQNKSFQRESQKCKGAKFIISLPKNK